MSNTINVNYMTRAYNQYQQKNAAKDPRTREKSFFMAKSSFLDDNMLNPALQVRCQTNVIFK